VIFTKKHSVRNRYSWWKTGREFHFEPFSRFISTEKIKPFLLFHAGGGGNTVRNITAPASAGIGDREPFDVTPYAVALTTALIRRDDSWLLPRKYKIAFASSLTMDEALASVQDLGFFPRVVNGKKGFRVFVAGGMGRKSEAGKLLHDFIVDTELFPVAEAIKRLFLKHGNRQNKHAARLRFLWNAFGRERFVQIYEVEKAALAAEGVGAHVLPKIVNAACSAPEGVTVRRDGSKAFSTWRARYVRSQAQKGAVSVTIPVLSGMMEANKARVMRLRRLRLPWKVRAPNWTAWATYAFAFPAAPAPGGGPGILREVAAKGPRYVSCLRHRRNSPRLRGNPSGKR
jgi:sulfite reductase beta subunit-like hemoprotein